MAWFPVLPPNQQSPYDPGPYRKLPLGALPGARAQLAAESGAGSRSLPISAAAARADAAILAQVRALPAGQVYSAPESNAWAANGPRVAGGRAMLAGDPHVLQTLPSVWYQVALSAPGLAVSGVSVPGLPAVVVGHNAHIAWSISDTQNQSTLFYREQTSKSRPGQYFWRGQWRQMRRLHYTIPVRGAATQQLTVDVTVHGPVLTRAGQTVSADWMGAVGSPDIAALDSIGRASDFAQFRTALAGWRSPTLNFVFADDRGQIGAISAGYYPQVAHGEPWLPLSGTGADDVAGVIPYRAVPQVLDPRSHIVAAANQRPVTGSYPYYIGTAANFFDPGFRADQEYSFLSRRHSMRPAAFAALQTSTTDRLAQQILPRLRAALRGTKVTPIEQQALLEFDGWNYSMSVSSASAAIWWTFWSDYLSAVFGPWWRADHVPVHVDPAGLSIGPRLVSLDEELETWTLHDQQNPAFTPPGAAPRDAATVMRQAFAAAVGQLAARQSASPSSWSWGKLHSREFPSLLTGRSLGYGPEAASGDAWTVNAAEAGLTSTVGPSWRMIVHFAGPGKPVAEGVYPGGQSENPASPWYINLVADWWAGKYLPMPAAGSVAGPVRWELMPS
jgi:penicillin amidase